LPQAILPLAEDDWFEWSSHKFGVYDLLSWP